METDAITPLEDWQQDLDCLITGYHDAIDAIQTHKRSVKGRIQRWEQGDRPPEDRDLTEWEVSQDAWRCVEEGKDLALDYWGALFKLKDFCTARMDRGLQEKALRAVLKTRGLRIRRYDPYGISVLGKPTPACSDVPKGTC